VRAPWPLEIYDHADRLHEIFMEPGDIVYYESARCLHGRQQAFEGNNFINLFAHYRPVGDNQWYTKPNPEGTPKALIDIGSCVNVGGKLECTGGDPEIDEETMALARSSLSPKLESVKGPDDLWNWWVRTSLPHPALDPSTRPKGAPGSAQATEKSEL